MVVVPKGFDRRRLPALLEAKRDWIENALQQVEARAAEIAVARRRPDTINLPAVDQRWRIEWRASDREDVSIERVGAFQLRGTGPIDDEVVWRSVLKRWLIERGQVHLVPWTQEMVATLGIRIERITVRCQRTRWGSYTTRPDREGTVSLNAQLLFLSHRLARYVILHELCHAVYADHSAAFWDLVRRHEPASDRLRGELRTAWRSVPAWVR